MAMYDCIVSREPHKWVQNLYNKPFVCTNSINSSIYFGQVSYFHSLKNKRKQREEKMYKLGWMSVQLDQTNEIREDLSVQLRLNGSYIK
jgi:hypothetical protein